jgi:AraC-like DNA-binding protein
MQDPRYYKEYTPAAHLTSYIDAYYVLRRDSSFKPVKRYIYADGLAEIFVNFGSSIPMVDDKIPLKPGRLYFGGTMTATSYITGQPDSRFVGVRFKPGGLSAFYKLNQFEFVDKIVDLPQPELYSIMYDDNKFVERLNRFFTRNLNPRVAHILSISETVYALRGQITVDALAKQNNISTRSLERHFNLTLGIGPKEFIKVVRFHNLIKKLQTKESQESLLRIAYEMGYYDHSHLSKEVKRYGGQNPSDLRGTSDM